MVFYIRYTLGYAHRGTMGYSGEQKMIEVKNLIELSSYITNPAQLSETHAVTAATFEYHIVDESQKSGGIVSYEEFMQQLLASYLAA